MPKGKYDSRCPHCGDGYNQMSDEPHVCRLTFAERNLLDELARYFARYSPNPDLGCAASDYMKERKPHDEAGR